MENVTCPGNMRELTEEELLMVSGGEFWRDVAVAGGGLLGGTFGGVIGGAVGTVVVGAAWDWVF